MKEQSDKVFIRNFSLIVVALILFTVTIVFLAKSVGFKEDGDIPSRATYTEDRIRPVADVRTATNNAAVTPEAAPEVITPEAAPEVITQETVPEAVAQETVPEAVAQETVPEAVAQETVPEAVAQETVPEAVAQEAAPEAVAREAAPEAAPAQVAASEGGVDGEKIYSSACAACHSTGLLGAPIPGSEEMAQRAESGLDAMLQNSLNGLNAMPARGGRPDLSDEQIKAIVEFMIK